jgi:alpha-tubulin suppressor-like RCC1 family protein
MSGTVKCWGTNGGGELGNGSTMNSSVPETVLNVKASLLSAGGGRVCAWTQDLTVECWGQNYGGDLDPSLPDENVTTPHTVPVDPHIVFVAPGGEYTCATGPNTGMWCWGISNEVFGNGLGVGIENVPPTLIPNINGADVYELAAGGDHVCILLQSHSIECWGDNSVGQLGDGMGSNSSTPMPVTGL